MRRGTCVASSHGPWGLWGAVRLRPRLGAESDPGVQTIPLFIPICNRNRPSPSCLSPAQIPLTPPPGSSGDKIGSTFV